MDTKTTVVEVPLGVLLALAATTTWTAEDATSLLPGQLTQPAIDPRVLPMPMDRAFRHMLDRIRDGLVSVVPLGRVVDDPDVDLEAGIVRYTVELPGASGL